MNSKELAQFMQSLNVREANGRKFYSSQYPQNLLSLKFENPLKFTTITDSSMMSFIADSVEFLSEDKTIDFLINGFLIRTLKLVEIKDINFHNASEEEYKKACDYYSDFI